MKLGDLKTALILTWQSTQSTAPPVALREAKRETSEQRVEQRGSPSALYQQLGVESFLGTSVSAVDKSRLASGC